MVEYVYTIGFGVLDLFMVSFFGHRHIDNFKYTEEKLENTIDYLINNNKEITFLVGKEGDFDWLASTVIRRKKKLYPNVELVLVLPYATSEYINNADCFENHYDYIYICEESSAAHPKAAYQVRNRNIVNRSNYCVFFVNRPCGGAAQTLKYAIKLNKPLINLSEETWRVAFAER